MRISENGGSVEEWDGVVIDENENKDYYAGNGDHYGEDDYYDYKSTSNATE